MSTSYFAVDVPNPTNLFVGIHQQDLRQPELRSVFAHSSFAMFLFRFITEQNATHRLQLEDLAEFDNRRDLQAEFQITHAGTFILVPVTTGMSTLAQFQPEAHCKLDSQLQIHAASLVDKHNQLTNLAKALLRLVFFRHDSLSMDGKLDQAELLAIVSRFDHLLSSGYRQKLQALVREKMGTAISVDQFIWFFQEYIVAAQVTEFDPVGLFSSLDFSRDTMRPLDCICAGLSF